MSPWIEGELKYTLECRQFDGGIELIGSKLEHSYPHYVACSKAQIAANRTSGMAKFVKILFLFIIRMTYNRNLSWHFLNLTIFKTKLCEEVRAYIVLNVMVFTQQPAILQSSGMCSGDDFLGQRSPFVSAPGCSTMVIKDQIPGVRLSERATDWSHEFPYKNYDTNDNSFVREE